MRSSGDRFVQIIREGRRGSRLAEGAGEVQVRISGIQREAAEAALTRLGQIFRNFPVRGWGLRTTRGRFYDVDSHSILVGGPGGGAIAEAFIEKVRKGLPGLEASIEGDQGAASPREVFQKISDIISAEMTNKSFGFSAESTRKAVAEIRQELDKLGG